MGSKTFLTCAEPNRSYNLRNRGLRDLNDHENMRLFLERLVVSGSKGKLDKR